MSVTTTVRAAATQATGARTRPAAKRAVSGRVVASAGARTSRGDATSATAPAPNNISSKVRILPPVTSSINHLKKKKWLAKNRSVPAIFEQLIHKEIIHSLFNAAAASQE